MPGFENSDEFHSLKVFSRINSTSRGVKDRKPFAAGRLEDLLCLCFQDVINCRAKKSAISFILNTLQTQNGFPAFSLSPRESNFYFIKSTVYLSEFLSNGKK